MMLPLIHLGCVRSKRNRFDLNDVLERNHPERQADE
jgi:hypothetical protein